MKDIFAAHEAYGIEGQELYHEEFITPVNRQKWRHYNADMEDFLRNLPKIELHVHLDGTFDPSLLYSLFQSTQKGYDCLPEKIFCPWDQTYFPVRATVEECNDEKDFHSLCTCRGKHSLHEMLKCFETFVPIVRGDLDLLETLALDFVKRQSKQNIVYTEVRYSPHFLAKGSDLGGGAGEDGQELVLDAGSIIDAVTRGLRRGEKEYGVKVNQILCCLTWRPEWADDIVTLAHERRDNFPCAIVGIDIAAGEEHFDKDKYPHLYEPHLQAFQRARELKLNVTVHAGEVGDDDSFVKMAVNDYGASRIGHGYRVVKNKATMELMRKKNIHFEVCPTSSVETGGWNHMERRHKDWEDHPAMTMIEHGLNVGFNSDDPAVFDTSLTWQYRVTVGKMRLPRQALCKSLYDSIGAAFISDDEKSGLRTLMKNYLEIGK